MSSSLLQVVHLLTRAVPAPDALLISQETSGYHYSAASRPTVPNWRPPNHPKCRSAQQTSVVGIIVVSGPPASGKSWWGALLRSEFGIPFLSRDDFKSPIYPLATEHGVPPGAAAEAVRTTWLIALGAVLDANLNVVADGVFNYDAHVDAFRDFVRDRHVRCFELRLDGDRAALRTRFEQRADPPLTPELEPGLAVALAREYVPVVPGAPSIEVDTSDLSIVDVEAVLQHLRAWMMEH